MKEKRLRSLVALGVLPLAFACGSASNEPGKTGTPPGGTPNGSAGAGNATGTPNGTAGTGTTPSGGGDTGNPNPSTGVCQQGVPVTTQIPMLLNRQYANVVRDLLGVTTVDNAPVADALVGDFKGAMTAPAWEVYKDVGAKIAAQVMASSTLKANFITCDPAATDCLKNTITTFGRKAFRRPLLADEVTAFQSLSSVTPAGTPAEVAEAVLNAFLVSPSFLLIPELNTEVDDPAKSTIKLSQQEVATRLSFLLWGSVPDDTLNAAADAKQLSDKSQILAQAQRMIQDRKKTGGFISAFHTDWAQMNNSSGHWFKGAKLHDPAVYPLYSDAAVAANQKEMDSFFEEVAYSGGSFQDLLLSNVAFVNKDNAALYGLDPATYGADMTKVTLDSTTTPRPGFLTRAGFLGSYADYGSSSPILRGAFTAIWMLGIGVPAPDPANTKLKPAGTYTTQRAYVEALTQADGTDCKGCHQAFNPIGFVFENYDGIGKWQTKDPLGGDITAATTTATVNFGDGQAPQQITSVAQLMQGIAKAPKAQQMYAQAWVTFATGRTANDFDQCTVDTLKTKLASTGGTAYTILSLLGDLTQADSFRVRVRGSL
jgi:hypothetical protein